MNAARLILPALRARDGEFAHEAQAIDEALALGVGGFIVFGGTAESVATLTGRLQRDAGYPLLLAADLERGAGQQFRGLTPLPPPRALASLDSHDAIWNAAVITALEARHVGINWIFAPVADLDLLAENPIVQTRAFGDDPERVAAAVREWVAGCQAAGALACVKHFPGHGRTVRDSHATLPTVAADRATLEADLIPFRAGVAAGVASVMTAHVAYPALDPSGLPGTRSRAIIQLLRESLAFDGAVVTDALMMAGATSGTSEAEAAGEVVMAGVDMLLYPSDVSGVAAALAVRAQESRVFAERIATSLRRREELLARVPAQLRSIDLTRHRAQADAVADTLVERGVLRGAVSKLRAPLELIYIDDDTDGDWPASPNTFVAEALAVAGVEFGPGGSRVVLAFCEARAGKGRGGFGARTQALLQQHQDADLTILFGHARLCDALPGATPVVCAWHRQALMQQAVARQLERWLA